MYTFEKRKKKKSRKCGKKNIKKLSSHIIRIDHEVIL